MDGETTIILTDENQANREGFMLAFDSSVETPKHEISVFTAFNEQILTLPTKIELSRLHVWINDAAEPSEIEIVVSGS